MLTIIVPFFDEIIYLRNALNSILCQRIDDIQVIVVNDNPDVFSEEDLAALGATGKIELIQHPANLGLSAARNSGLRQARGRFVGFLDSDDFYTLGGLAHHLGRAVATGADITHSQTYLSRLGSTRVRIQARDAAYFATACTKRGLEHAQEAQFITSSWSSLYDRAFLADNDLWFDEKQPRFEDRLFVLHTVTRARSITFTGRPTRVWRGRAGSISVSATTPETHRLQVQLLQKCVTHMRAEVTAGRLKPIFAKRELFNTVSRLIWDMDLIEAFSRNSDPFYHQLAQQVSQFLGDRSFAKVVLGDKTLQPINRIGTTTRKGRISRAAFFSIHRAMRAGDFGDAQAQIKACAIVRSDPMPKPPRRAKRLVLHLGLHKTGTTYLQNHLDQHRDKLLDYSVLVPKTGFEIQPNPMRTGATPGHQGLVKALHQSDTETWQELTQEIHQSGADTVVLSCENMVFPTLADRDEKISFLAECLRGFDQVDLIALVRRADTYVESCYRERVANGSRAATEGLDGFVADYGSMFCNLPALFSGFEDHFNTRIKLADFDKLAAENRLWTGFLALANLPDNLPALEMARYPTPDRIAIQIFHLLNTLVSNATLRAEILTAWYAMHPKPGADSSLIPPQSRMKLLDMWQEQSGDFARDRGYEPDIAAARATLEAEDWHPPETLPVAYVQELIAIANQAAGTLVIKDKQNRQ